MSTITGPAGSIHRGRVVQRRRLPLTVTGVPAGPVWLTWGRTELGRGVAGLPMVCDLSGLPLGPAQIVARWPAGSDTKTTTVVSDLPPGPETTGCRIPEADLTPWSGGVIRADLLLTGRIITQPIAVRGARLTMVDCIVRTPRMSGELIVDVRDGGSLDMSDCEVDGQGGARIGVGYARVEVRRCNIHSTNDGLRMASGSLLEDSWVHDLIRHDTDHPDCVQITGGSGITVRHNNLNSASEGEMGNAALMIQSATAPVADVLIEDNWLDGGNYTVNITVNAGPAVTLRGNRYGGTWRYGPILAPDGVTTDRDIVTATGSLPKIVRAR